MFIVNAKMYHYFMNLLFLYVCMFYFLVYLHAPFLCMFSLVGHMSLVWVFSMIVPAYISFLGVGVCVLLSIIKFM
jgi:hypothetical protein